jgi:hypothetical protein
MAPLLLDAGHAKQARDPHGGARPPSARQQVTRTDDDSRDTFVLMH